jgi:hypothetical protein
MQKCEVTAAEMEKAVNDDTDVTICTKCGAATLEVIYKWAFGQKQYINL